MSSFFPQKSYEESLEAPEFVFSDFAKMERPAQLHLAYRAAHEYVARNGRFPGPWSTDDANKFIDLVREIKERTNSDVELNEDCLKLLNMFSYQLCGDVPPIQSVIGSITAQEILKACSGKFGPIFQWFYFDALECLPPELTPELFAADARIDDRYQGKWIFAQNISLSASFN